MIEVVVVVVCMVGVGASSGDCNCGGEVGVAVVFCFFDGVGDGGVGGVCMLFAASGAVVGGGRGVMEDGEVLLGFGVVWGGSDGGGDDKELCEEEGIRRCEVCKRTTCHLKFVGAGGRGFLALGRLGLACCVGGVGVGGGCDVEVDIGEK
jgi:hypothetical protein